MIYTVHILIQTTASTTITAIQIIASVLTIFLGGIQLYDYVSERDVYNKESGRTSEFYSSDNSSNFLSSIRHQNEVRYLTISLFTFVSLSASATTQSIIILYISSVIIGISLITEYSNSVPNHNNWSDISPIGKILVGNIFFAAIFYVSTDDSVRGSTR